MIVCIAEKPSVAREIAAVLGAQTPHNGYMEGNGYQVTWTFGHLCTLKEPHDYDARWKRWESFALPLFPERFGIKLINDNGIQKQFAIIERLMQAADEVINCGDAGQEGELIQRWVMQKAACKCPVRRLWISSLTEEAIRDGFKHLYPQEHFQPLYEAGLARAIGDWLLGINATRLYTLRYGKHGQILSVGRVQTPTLALIVNRQKAIAHFEPQQYWELKTIYRDTTFSAVVRKSDEELAEDADDTPRTPTDKKTTKSPNSKENIGIDPIANREQGDALVLRIKDQPFVVQAVTKKQSKELPPRLYDLTSLQVHCNRKFGFSADETLKLIQSLYEKKLTTYPRVDTTFLSDDVYAQCPAILRGLRDYTTLTKQIENITLPKSKKVFDNSKITDHHAIIPTGQCNAPMTAAEHSVYDLVVRHFIAIFYPDCKIATTSIEGLVADVPFHTSGKQIIDPGWRVVFANTDEVDTDDHINTDKTEKTLPAFKRGEQGQHQPLLDEKWTQPPRPYTEATLLRAMETAGKFVEDDELRDVLKENGIGRPSTRAAIIETLFKRNYIRKERKTLIATPTGIALIDTIQEDLLKSAELTGQWEHKLRNIEKGVFAANTFITELKEMISRIVNNVRNDAPQHSMAAQPPLVTELKQKSAAIKRSKRTTAKTPIEGSACPKCGKGIIIKGHTAYGCSEWRKGCNWRLPFKTLNNLTSPQRDKK